MSTLLAANRGRRVQPNQDRLAGERFCFETKPGLAAGTEAYYALPRVLSGTLTVDSGVSDNSPPQCMMSTMYKTNAVERWKSISPVRKHDLVLTKSIMSTEENPSRTRLRFIHSPRLRTTSTNHNASVHKPKAPSIPPPPPAKVCGIPFPKGDYCLRNAAPISVRQPIIKGLLSAVASSLHRRRRQNVGDGFGTHTEFQRIFDSETLDQPHIEAIQRQIESMEKDRYDPQKQQPHAPAVKPTGKSKFVAEFERDVRVRRREMAPLRLAEVKSSNAGVLDKIRKYVPITNSLPLPRLDPAETLALQESPELLTTVEKSVEEIAEEQSYAAAQDAKVAFRAKLAREFFYATKHGDVDTVRLLLRKDPALVSQTDHLCQTPLHFAMKNGDGGMVKLLLEHGADEEAKDIVSFIRMGNVMRSSRGLRGR